ncbi:MAG: hypothetical protein SGPRY_009267, partial [Prymnesium sp.]
MLLEIKPPDNAFSFLCETSVHCDVPTVLSRVVLLFNLRSRLAALSPTAAFQATAAPTAARSLAAADASTSRKRTFDDAFPLVMAFLSAESVKKKLVATPELLLELITACKEELESQAGSTELEEASAGLQFAGRWLESDKKLSDYVGCNEKTKVSVSLCISGVPPNACGRLAAAVSEIPPAASSTEPPTSATSTSLIAAMPEGSASLSSYFRAKGETNSAEDLRASEGADLQGEEEEEEAMLTAAQGESLCSSPQVFAALGNQRLQKLVREIDSTTSRETAL